MRSYVLAEFAHGTFVLANGFADIIQIINVVLTFDLLLDALIIHQEVPHVLLFNQISVLW